MRMVCDIPTNMELIRVQYSTYTNVMWKLEEFQCTYAESGLYRCAGDSLVSSCSTSGKKKKKDLDRFWDFFFLNELGGIFVEKPIHYSK